MDNIPHNDQIKLAITNLKSQSHPNFSATVRKYEVERTTLAKRFRSETRSREEATSNSFKTLTNVQENVLV